MKAVQPRATSIEVDTSIKRCLGLLDTEPHHSLRDVTLLTAFFSMISEEQDARELAESALQSFGSFGRIFYASTDELHVVLAKNERLTAGIDIIRLTLEKVVSERTSAQITINNPAAMAEYVAFHRNPASSGCRRAVFLDRNSRLVRDVSLSMSRTDSEACRDIAQFALEADAFGLVLIEYLYKDNIEPSQKIRALDEKLHRTMSNIDIDIYDHLIVGINRMYSCKQKTIIPL